MGRRPNAVISEWFFRGAKIEDASNRYAHTCRRCGELVRILAETMIATDLVQFAKGRVEYLMEHLLKKCPNITDSDRATILIQQTAQPRSIGKSSGRADDVLRFDSTLPISLERQQSALDTLAEVSRHHLDYSVQRHANLSEQDLADQALWAHLQQHALDFQPSDNAVDYAMSNDMHPPRIFPDSSPGYVAAFAHLDPQLDEDAAQLAAHLTTDSYEDPRHNRSVTETTPETPDNSLPASIPVASNPPRQHSGLSSNSQLRAKPRSKFTETRRREVQEIRKRGACIRCRMLKKPCSEGTPCKTCANVDVARLWKGRCIRTKLSDEFTAWNEQYFGNLWAMRNQDSLTEEQAVPAIELEVGFFSPGSDVVLLPVTAQQQQIFAHQDGSIPIISIADTDSCNERLVRHLLDTDVARRAIEHESNQLVKATIQEVLGARDTASDATTDGQHMDHVGVANKSSHSITTQLLQNITQLWILTRLITSWNDQSQDVSVQLRSKSPIDAPSNVIAALHAANHDRLRLQLFAMLERRASVLSKAVITDIERRLLQRQQVSSSATFLTAIILLSCVERMTDFFYTIDSQINIAADQSAIQWPLSASPNAIWSQGPNFALLLQMLLRIRGLPPQVYENEHGILTVLEQGSDGISKLNGSVSEAQLRAHDEERRQVLTAWLHKANIRAADVRSWLIQEQGWDGKFIAGALIDERNADESWHVGKLK